MNDTRDFDPLALQRLRRIGGNGLIRQLVAIFGEYVSDRVQDAVSAGRAGHLDRVAGAAHAIRSSAGNVGALRLLNVAADLEAAARAGRAAPIPALVSDLHTAFVAARRWLATAVQEAA